MISSIKHALVKIDITCNHPHYESIMVLLREISQKSLAAIKGQSPLFSMIVF